MSNFEQFLGGSEKLGEVIPMVSSEMPYIFSASGGTYLRSGYATTNSGLYDTYKGLTYTDTVILPYTGETTNTSTLPLLKSGANYINGKNYTTDLTTAWTAATGGALTTNLYNSFIVGTTVVHTPSANALGSLEYSTDNGVTYTSVVGNNVACRGVVNDAGTLAVVIKSSGAGTTAGDIYTSTDGITWTSRTPSIAVGNVYSLIWSPLLSAFVIRAANGTYSTTNGYTLTLLTTTTTVNGSTASSTTSMVSVESGNSTFSRTVDGVNWSTATSLVSGQTFYPVTSIVYVNSAYYAFGGHGVVFKSIDDGLTWERFFVSFDDTYTLAASNYASRVGWIDGALFFSTEAKLKTNATLTVNGVMAKVKAEPTEGYAYVRIQ